MPIFIAKGQLILTFNLLYKRVSSEFTKILGQMIKPNSSLIFVSLFFFVLVNNFLGLFGYVFTCSTHIRYTLSLAIPIWLGPVIYVFYRNSTFIFAHLVPSGTPGGLVPFIILVERVRTIIRPLTLAVRLIANITAGHLLLSLIRSRISLRILNPTGVIAIVALVILGVLETGVSFIQAYVFRLLSVLYLEEIQSAV